MDLVTLIALGGIAIQILGFAVGFGMMKQSLSEVRTDVHKIRDKLNNGVTETIARHGERLDGHDERLDGQDKRITGLEHKMWS